MEDNSDFYRVIQFKTYWGDYGWRVEEKIWGFWWVTVHKDPDYYRMVWWANQMGTHFRCDVIRLDGTVETWQKRIRK